MYKDADVIEHSLGVSVLRHDQKKPSGIDAVTGYFNCPPEELVMVGDRILTDIVFGNRYGLLTVHTQLLTQANDNKAASATRDWEQALLDGWKEQGINPPGHKLYEPDLCYQ